MATHISQKQVKVRKHQQCLMCYRTFEPGTIMELNTSVYDGRIGSCYVCDTCKELCKADHDNLYDWDGFYPAGCVHESLENEETPEQYLERVQLSKAAH